jgi:hypothetical protein
MAQGTKPTGKVSRMIGTRGIGKAEVGHQIAGA